MASPVRDFLGRVLGVITTASATGSPFVPEDQELFEALAVFGTSTIKHTQVLEDARARTEEAEVMNDVGKLLTADIGTAMVVPRIISAAYSIMKCERVTLFNIESVQVMESQKISEEQKEIVCIVSKDSNFVGTRIAWGSGIVGHVAMTRNPLNIHNAYEDSRFFKKADKSTGFVTKSILTVPVCDSHGTGVAIIQAVNKLRDPDEVFLDDHIPSFSEHYVHLLESLAVLAGTALEKSKLYYKAKAAERKANALLSLLNVKLNRHHSFVMDDFKTITRQALDCEYCTILFVDRSRGQMFSADAPSSLTIPFSEKNFVSECVKTGRAVNLSRADSDDRYQKNFDVFSYLSNSDSNEVDPAYVADAVLLMPVFEGNGNHNVIALLQCGNKNHRAVDMAHYVNVGQPTRVRQNKDGSKVSEYCYFTQDDEDVLRTICERVREGLRLCQVTAVTEHMGEANGRIESMINIYRHADGVPQSPQAGIGRARLKSMFEENKSSLAKGNSLLLRVEKPHPSDKYFQKKRALVTLPIAVGDVYAKMFAACKTATFSVFDYSEVDLCLCSVYMLNLFVDEIKFDKDSAGPSRLQIKSFVRHVCAGYHEDNSYHNWMHAVGVLQVCFYVLCEFQRQGMVMFDAETSYAMLLAALAHDVDHPGTNNNFQVVTATELALRYNDKSVLENHHVSVMFMLLRAKDCNVLEGFDPSQYTQLRKMIVECVLATDMASHFNFIKQVNEIEELNEEVVGAKTNFLINCIVHAADICGQCFPLEVAKVWESRISEEFDKQAKLETELGMDVAPFMVGLDSFKTRMKQHLGFLDYVLKPWFGGLSRIMEPFITYNEQMLANRIRYGEFYEQAQKDEGED